MKEPEGNCRSLAFSSLLLILNCLSLKVGNHCVHKTICIRERYFLTQGDWLQKICLVFLKFATLTKPNLVKFCQESFRTGVIAVAESLSVHCVLYYLEFSVMNCSCCWVCSLTYSPCPRYTEQRWTDRYVAALSVYASFIPNWFCWWQEDKLSLRLRNSIDIIIVYSSSGQIPYEDYKLAILSLWAMAIRLWAWSTVLET